MNNILMVGFPPDINIKIFGYTTIHHAPFRLMEGGLSLKEYEILCKKVVENSKLLVLNLDKKYLTFDESFLLVHAYTKSIPIVGVGQKIKDFTLNIVLSNKFAFIDDLKNHVKNNY